MTRSSESNIRDSGLRAFEGVMEEHLPDGILEHVNRFIDQHNGLAPNVLNFLGGPKIIRELGVFGASINDEIINPEVDNSTQCTQLIWDIGDPNSLGTLLMNYNEDKGNTGFDLIIARPISQDRLIPRNSKVVRAIILTLFANLNHDGNIVYHGIPGKISDGAIREILGEVEKGGHNVDISFRERQITGFRIVKQITPIAPDNHQ